MTQTAPTSSPPRTDEELLVEFIGRRNEAAFAQVVQHHGGMVLAVCRSVLGNSTEAQDAAQAVFLTLAQKASSRHVQRHLVGWLHRVAWYVAARALAAKVIRRRHEQEAARMKPEAPAEPAAPITLEQLHAGLAELPEKYRVPLLLHHLEGRTQEETAALIGCTPGAVAMRLNRGRELLRQRMTRRKPGLTSASMGIFLGGLTPAATPPTFVALAAKTASAVLAKQLATSAIVSASTLTLSKGALNMLFWAQVKLVALAAAVVILTGGAVGTYVATAAPAPHPKTLAAAPADQKQTITGIAKALPNYVPGKMDPKVSIATVTVTVNGADTVYHVYGWAGNICAMNDGKTVEVTGKVYTDSAGQLAILAASVNVKVIVVQ